ncbi:MAG: DUF2262 domain-containing protein, partial [Deferribacteraceae bacterium]|nr:DUF2262 domain-containing protein [Deferribacteraceae bacterium]
MNYEEDKREFFSCDPLWFKHVRHDSVLIDCVASAMLEIENANDDEAIKNALAAALMELDTLPAELAKRIDAACVRNFSLAEYLYEYTGNYAPSGTKMAYGGDYADSILILIRLGLLGLDLAPFVAINAMKVDSHANIFEDDNAFVIELANKALPFASGKAVELLHRYLHEQGQAIDISQYTSNFWNRPTGPSQEEIEAFASEYSTEEKEILALTDESGAVIGSDPQYIYKFLKATIDLATEKLTVAHGRLGWLQREDESEAFGIWGPHAYNYPYEFKDDTIYRLKVRQLLPTEEVKNYENHFMILEILEEGVDNDALFAAVAEVEDAFPEEIVETFGTLEFEDDYGCYYVGEITWLDGSIEVRVEVDEDEPESVEAAMAALRTIHERQKELSKEWREYVATNLAANGRPVPDDILTS